MQYTSRTLPLVNIKMSVTSGKASYTTSKSARAFGSLVLTKVQGRSYIANRVLDAAALSCVSTVSGL